MKLRTPLLSIAAAQPAQAGDYDVVVANAHGAVTSMVARLTVLLPPTNDCANARSIGDVMVLVERSSLPANRKQPLQVSLEAAQRSPYPIAASIIFDDSPSIPLISQFSADGRSLMPALDPKSAIESDRKPVTTSTTTACRRRPTLEVSRPTRPDASRAPRAACP